MTRYYRSMQYTLYIRKGIDELFAAEEDKSKLVNELLNTHYGIERTLRQPIVKPLGKMPVAKKIPAKALPNIPGVVRASEVLCKGDHYMSRHDCGKPGCPWSGK